MVTIVDISSSKQPPENRLISNLFKIPLLALGQGHSSSCVKSGILTLGTHGEL